MNRKLSSLRRYVSWAGEEGLINPDFQVLNESKLKATPILITGEQTIPIVYPPKANSYSKFPPLRLIQKSKVGIITVFDAILINRIAHLLSKFDHAVWTMKGKPVFLKPDRGIKNFKSILSSFGHGSEGPVKNIPKSFYAPLLISTANFPIHKKIWYHTRYSRPNWYRKYHSYAVVSYIHLSILMIFISLMGYILFNSLNPEKQTAVLAALPSAPPRVLSFQGRLTNDSDVPIVSATDVVFKIYDARTAVNLLWTSKTWSV